MRRGLGTCFLIVGVAWFCDVFVYISRVGIGCVVVVAVLALQCQQVFFWLGISGGSVVLHRFGLEVLFIFVMCCTTFLFWRCR